MSTAAAALYRGDRETLERSVFARLKQFIAYAQEHVPVYHRLYGGLDVERELETIGDLERLPLLGPRAIRAAGPLDLVPEDRARLLRAAPPGRARRIRDPIVESFSSSGSTGQPKITYYTRQDWEANASVYAEVMEHIPFDQRNRVYCLFHPGHIGGAAYKKMIQDEGGVFVAKHFAIATAEEALREMMRRPEGPFNALAAPPRPPRTTAVGKGVTLVDLIEAEARLGTNYLGEHVRTVIVNGGPIRYPDDPLDLVAIMHRKNEAARVGFRTAFSDQGGAAETLYNFASREPHLPRAHHETGGDARFGMHALHLAQGRNWVEVIDPHTGRHVGHRRRGLLTVTSMRYGSVYIRYLVGDSAVYLDPAEEPCPTGYTTPRVFSICRIHDLQRLESGCAAGEG